MSSDDTTTRAKDLFLDALELDGSAREAFLDERCGSNETLRARVDGLLAAHDSSDRVLAEPISPLARLVDLGPGDRVGPYVLGEVLGEGGFGVVFRAEQQEPVRRSVALKVVKLGMDTKAVISRFEAERQALALMEHPNIARVFDAGATETGRPYFVMELVDGVPVTDYCDARGLDPRARLELFRTTALAVQHAHQKGVVHRDLKPSNVLVAEIDGEAVPKVIDFGIAKAAGAELGDHGTLSREGHQIGTPVYMSPEQVRGSVDVDTRADVYALGALLYELLTGAPPFAGLELLELQQAILDTDPVRPSGARSTVTTGTGRMRIPDELDWIAMRCLEKDAGRRYPTAFALAADVGRFLGNLPLEAGPPSTTYRLKKLVRRHRVATTAALLVLASLLLGGAGTILGLLEAQRANEELADSLVREKEESERARLAELRATEEAREARLQERIANETNDFLNDDLLGAASPYDESGFRHDVTLREVLDLAARRIGNASTPGGRFADDPQVEAAVRMTLGQTYSDLGEYEAALPHIRRAYELSKRDASADEDRTLQTASLLAGVLRRTGQSEEAEQILVATLEAQRRLSGTADQHTLFTVGRLARIWAQTGRVDEAIELGEATLEEALPVLGEDDAGSISLMETIATITAEDARFDRAEALFERVLEARRRTLGREAPDSAGALMNLALFYSKRRRHDLAEPLFVEALAIHEETLGPEHPATVDSLAGLAHCKGALGRPDEARDLYELAVEHSVSTLGATHPRTLRIQVSLSKIHGALGQLDRVEELLLTALDGYRATVEPGDDGLRRAERDLGFLYMATRRHDEADEVFTRIYDAERARFGEAHTVTLETLLYRANLEVLRDDFGRAEGLLREGLASCLERHGTNNAWAVSLASKLAESLNRMGRHEEAVSISANAVEWARVATEPKSFELSSSLLELGLALARIGRHTEAEGPLLEAFAIFDERHPTVTKRLQIALELARLYRALGRPEDEARYSAIDPRIPEMLER